MSPSSSRRARTRWSAIAALGASMAIAGCSEEAEVLPPFPEVVVVVDTDAHVPDPFERMQIDLYLPPEIPGGDPIWFFTERLGRRDPSTWPVSFTLSRDANDEARELLVRVRLFPEGKLRDQRGEAFFEDATLATYDESCPTFLEADRLTDGLLRQLGEDGELDGGVSPRDEPLPNVTIDRLARVRLEPETLGTVTLVLRTACAGIQADLFTPASCIDGAVRRVPLGLEPVDDGAEPPPPGSDLLGSYPAPAPCEASLRTPRPGLFEEEACIDGGAFILGDRAVFGYGDFGFFDGFPEHIAAVPPLRIDRYEVTVGRFRALLEAGALDGAAMPRDNEGPLAGIESAFDDTDAGRQRHCTWSTTPLDPSREDYPLNCVTFETARAFCRADGGDLPTEAQWEYVAAAYGRAFEDRFPWGSDEPTCDHAVFGRGATEDVSACLDVYGYGVAPEGEPTGDETPSGVRNLGGNLREWTLDDRRPYCSACWELASVDDPRCDVEATAQKTVRGGDWAHGEDGLLVALRDQGFDEDAWDPRVGFRCVRDARGVTSGGD